MSSSTSVDQLSAAPLVVSPTGGAGVRRFLSLPEMRWAVSATVLFAVGGVCQLALAPSVIWWALYLACYAAGGWEPGWAGLRALRARTLDVDLLMIVAAVIAAAIGQVFDGALLIVIFATSGALEAVATARTSDSVRALLDLAPQQATRLDGGGESVVDCADLVVGDLVVVRPGERIGADGKVIGGASDVDQASITGEPLPAVKQIGDVVFAGTLNGAGALTIRVDRVAGDSVMARIVDLVQKASATKAKTQLFIEKIEQRYSIGVVAATLALFVVPLLFHAALRPTLLRAMTFMIVASPCAVVLATMPPLLSAIANAGRRGVLVKSAVIMEQVGLTDLVAFDKTGTLTEGAPQVVSVHTLPGVSVTENQVLAAAAAVEHQSEHPLAAAIVVAAEHRNLELGVVESFRSAPGRGVTGRVDGVAVQVGSPAAAYSKGDLVSELQAGGHTAVVVSIKDRPVGVIALTDQMRTGADESVTALTALTGRRPVLLTGDNLLAATVLARRVGISDVHADLLPTEKVEHIQVLTRNGRAVMVVGDGVNDAPAMAAAHLGVAMGRRGSDLALETADIVLVRDDLTTLAALIDLGRRARRTVTANLVVAAVVITALVVWDLTGHLPLPLGVAGHESSTVIVGLNGLRLLRARAWRIHPTSALAEDSE